MRHTKRNGNRETGEKIVTLSKASLCRAECDVTKCSYGEDQLPVSEVVYCRRG